MIHSHRCAVCRRTWTHNPDTWPPFENACERADRLVREHSCCGQVWVDHWPPPWPLRVLGSTLYRGLRGAVRLVRKLGRSLVQFDQRAPS